MRALAAIVCVLAASSATAQGRDGRFVGDDLLLLCDRPLGTTCFTVRNSPVAIVESDGAYSRVELRDGRTGWTEASTAQSLNIDEMHARAADAPLHPDMRATCAKRGGVSVQMTAAQVLKSCWGKPRAVNLTVTAGGKREQWVYRGGYIYLDNGVVSAVQTSQ